MIKNITDFIAKSTFGRSYEGLHVEPGAYVATDSFKLIKIPADTGATEAYTIKLPKGLKNIDSTAQDGTITYKGARYTGEIIKDAFPKYEEIIPKGEPIATVTLSASHLEAICKAFKDQGPLNDAFTIEIHEEHVPVVFKNKPGMLALLMPIIK